MEDAEEVVVIEFMLYQASCNGRLFSTLENFSYHLVMKYTFIALSILVLFGCGEPEESRRKRELRIQENFERSKRGKIKKKIKEWISDSAAGKGPLQFLDDQRELKTTDSLTYFGKEGIILKNDTLDIRYVAVFEEKLSIEFQISQLSQ